MNTHIPDTERLARQLQRNDLLFARGELDFGKLAELPEGGVEAGVGGELEVAGHHTPERLAEKPCMPGDGE